jgi:HEAT repeat protein
MSRIEPARPACGDAPDGVTAAMPRATRADRAMRRRGPPIAAAAIIARAMFAFLLATLFCIQEPAPAPKQPARPVDAAAPAPKKVETWDDRAAKAAVDGLAKALKTAQNLADRSAALEQLAGGANAQLVKPLVRLVETDKATTIQRRAVQLLANQPAAAAGPALLKLLDNLRVKTSAPVAAEVVRALSHCGYEAGCWDRLAALFEQSYATEFVPLHVAVLDVAIVHKEKLALPLLLRNLDEPVPSDVDAAHNPPAEYWKARWTSWSQWRDKVKEALFTITGQRFASAAEAKAWLDKNPPK